MLKQLSLIGRHGFEEDQTPMIFVCGVSRSGTTLLSAILNAHSHVCMGFEILFPPSTSTRLIAEKLIEIRSKARDLQRAGSLLRKQGLINIGKWVSRCHRLGLEFEDLQTILEEHRKMHGDSLLTLEKRLLLIKAVLDTPEVKNGATHLGFKITDSDFERFLAFFPNATFVYIVRDPRDVYASLKSANFGVSLQMSTKRWVKTLESFLEFKERHPERCQIVRYENIISDPRSSLHSVFTLAGLEMEDGVLEFQQSGAKILNSTHPNAENLRKGLFDNSRGRFLKDLAAEDVLSICDTCGKLMRSVGYLTQEIGHLPGHKPKLYKIPPDELKRKMKVLNGKAKFEKEAYMALLKPCLDEGYEVMPLLQFIREENIGDRKVLVIRHDVDHNHLNAMKMAKWEQLHGIRSTYCLLHTAWYYGKLENGFINHTTDLVDCVKYLYGLGHEINLHNNFAVTALKEGIEVEKLLRQELDFFLSIGIEIKGTSTHGDILCRELNFRNYEVFRETCDGRYGGPRAIIYQNEENRSIVTLGEIPMHDFGLEYEAYEIFWDIYHTDSGGNLQTKFNRKGMRPFGRKDRTRGSLVGVLTHPVWWNF
jgi:hypothetical protein